MAREIPTKTCIHCKELKPAWEYFIHPKTFDKLSSRCKLCSKKLKKESPIQKLRRHSISYGKEPRL